MKKLSTAKYKYLLKNNLKPIVVLLELFGINIYKLFLFRRFPRYIHDRNEWLKKGGTITHTLPILFDYNDSAGIAGGHYFHQDLLIASLIAKMNPKRHIDIGSRIDGFVSHVASFRKIEVIDIRPLPDTGHENISFIQADIMNQSHDFPSADSVSCLHAIEHLGMGRYNDPIDPDGYQRGFITISNMVEPDGMLYVSFPIGNNNEIHFNAHRIFNPLAIFEWNNIDKLKLERFDYVDDAGKLHQNFALHKRNLNIKHGCGIYSFRKLS